MSRRISVMWLGLRGFPEVQGGVETHAEQICTSLVAMGCDVEVVVRAGYQPDHVGSIWKGVRFTRLWAPRSRAFEAIIHTFLGVLYAAVRRPDVLHIQAVGPALLTPLARLFGLRVVVTHHGPDYDRQKWGMAARSLLKLGERLGMRFSNERIVISRHIAGIVSEKYGRESVIIPNGVVLPELPETTGALERFGLHSGRYVLLVSRIVPEKRHHDLINAFAGAALPGWKLAIVGASDHPDDYTASVIEAAGRHPGVVCTGYQSGVALNELYAHAGVFVLPSSHEGLPIALLEALSFGLPVVASDIPANLEVEAEGISYFPLGDVGALSQSLRTIAARASEPYKPDSLRAAVSAKYNWTDIAEKTAAVYGAVTGISATPVPVHAGAAAGMAVDTAPLPVRPDLRPEPAVLEEQAR